jgi:hypothetical protein
VGTHVFVRTRPAQQEVVDGRVKPGHGEEQLWKRSRCIFRMVTKISPDTPAHSPELPVAEAIHQRFLLAAVDLDHRAVDKMRQIGSEVGDKAGHLLAFGNAPQWDAARG